MVSTMRLKAWPVVSEAVETGIAFGITRACRHTETPTREQLTEHLRREVLNALCEVIDFGEPE